jgi:hypothetical protein
VIFYRLFINLPQCHNTIKMLYFIIMCDVITKQMYGMRCLRDVCTISTQCVARTSQEHRTGITWHSLIYFASWEHILSWECHFFIHGKCQQYKKTLWIFTYMIYEEFFVGFFLQILLSEKKARFALFPIQLDLISFIIC